MMKRIGIGWLTAAACFFLGACRTPDGYRITRADCRVMKKEADRFLHALPAGLQQRQTAAIRKAIEGDNAALNAVRHSRNAVPDTVENVKTRMLAPTLRLYEPAGNGGPLPLLIYLHGGGWTFGSLNSCARFCQAVAASGRMKVLAVDYRLAPENPFPAGLDDCRRAVLYAHSHAGLLGIDENRIAVGGDSSGGNLALATALSPACRDRIESLVLFYPVTKAFDDGSDSWRKYGTGYGLDAQIMCAFDSAYVADGSPYDAQISVALYSDSVLSRLPRTLLVAAGRDILRDQGKELARRVGKRMTRIEFRDAVHLFITVAGQERAFGKAVDFTARFIGRL